MAKLKFISFNCKGFKPRNYDYLSYLFKQCDIMMIQETWLYSFQEDIITDTLGDSCCHAVSAMSDDDVGRLGRPFGGCAIVWNKNLPIHVTPILTSSNRLCAISITTPQNSFLIFSIYMPVHNGSQVTCNEFRDVLIEVSSLVRAHDDFTVLIGGDFNLDIKRDLNSSEFLILNDFFIG